MNLPTHQDDGSDMEYLFNSIISGGLITLETTEAGKKKIAGSFFKYYNKTDFDLSRYDIYRKIDNLDYTNNCLFIALQNGGLSGEKLNGYKSIVQNGLVPLSKLNIKREKI